MATRRREPARSLSPRIVELLKLHFTPEPISCTVLDISRSSSRRYLSSYIMAADEAAPVSK